MAVAKIKAGLGVCCGEPEASATIESGEFFLSSLFLSELKIFPQRSRSCLSCLTGQNWAIELGHLPPSEPIEGKQQ